MAQIRESEAWRTVIAAHSYRKADDEVTRLSREVEQLTEALKMVLWSLEGLAADSVHPLHAAVYHAHEVLAAVEKIRE